MQYAKCHTIQTNKNQKETEQYITDSGYYRKTAETARAADVNAETPKAEQKQRNCPQTTEGSHSS